MCHLAQSSLHNSRLIEEGQWVMGFLLKAGYLKFQLVDFGTIWAPSIQDKTKSFSYIILNNNFNFQINLFRYLKVLFSLQLGIL